MPSCRIDDCAHRVLVAAGWPIRILMSSSSAPIGCDGSSSHSPSTPHLDELERSLDLHCLPPSQQQQSITGKVSNKNDGWKTPWAPHINDDEEDDDGPSLLVELAPFTPEFYVALSTLVIEAYRPSSGTNNERDYSSQSSSSLSTTDRQQLLHEVLRSVEIYSLPRMHDATRVTRILLSLNANVVTTNTTTTTTMMLEDGGCGEHPLPRSVLALLLIHSGGRSNNVLLPALFYHWSNLSRTERALRKLVVRYSSLLPMDPVSYTNYRNYQQQCSGSTTGGGGGDAPIMLIPSADPGGGRSYHNSSSTSSLIGERAVSIDTLRTRLESELESHVTSLRDLLASLYENADVASRGKCRKWMGGWLRHFSFGGGADALSSSSGGAMGSMDDTDVLGSSFTSFCPLLFSITTISKTSTATTKGGYVAGMGPISIGLGVARADIIPQNNALGVENTSACGVEALLQVLLRIVLGFRPIDDGKMRASHRRLLFDVILPMHRPSGMVLWRDQIPLIGLYHESLTKILGAFLALDRTLVGPVIGALLHPDIWPVGEGGNTPKVILLLHEADTLLELLSGSTSDDNVDADYYLSSFDTHLLPLVMRLCSCISSENSRTSERALQFFRNRTFVCLVQRRLSDIGPILLRALCRCPSMDVPWNPTVKKMTLLVMQNLEGYYNGDRQTSFRNACDDALSGINLSLRDDRLSDTVIRRSMGTARVNPHLERPTISDNLTSIRGAMGSWKPLPQKLLGKGPSSAQPPLTVTGVAPWAMGGQSHGQTQPPLTVTGVAPWAMAKLPAQRSIPRPSRRSTGQSSKILGNSVDDVTPNDDDESPEQNKIIRTALDEVRLYMAKLKPKEDIEESTDGVSSWSKAQMNESPVLLQDLKFHDLVFGQDLGSGAFGTVKYARHIDKTKTRSKWPEYAVKVVSTQKIEEMGYEQSINMEIAILRTLSHPGISRLVSSFRFRDGAYLVLEYASGGDLHTLLRRNGSLDHDSTRFVIGSVAAALSSIHERGFVYADCKPENVLITETGHIKVTDFGGCRPVTQEAKLLVKESSKNLLKQLRDGGWRPNQDKPSSSCSDGVTKREDNKEEDLRIEGTTAYLPPEVFFWWFSYNCCRRVGAWLCFVPMHIW